MKNPTLSWLIAYLSELKTKYGEATVKGVKLPLKLTVVAPLPTTEKPEETKKDN